MAYNSAHTGPEIDAAVQLLGEIQSAKDATAADRQAVSGIAATVATQASQVSSQAASVSSSTAAVLSAASAVEADRADVEQNKDLALSAKNSAEEASAVAVSAKEAVKAIQSAVNQSQIEISLAEQNAGDSASSARADREFVETLAQQVGQDSASAAASAASAAEVVTGGTATLTPEPGKIPLAKGDGRIDSEWLPEDIARSSAVVAVSEKADSAISAAEAAEARTARNLTPSDTPPELRDNGLPLEIGDVWFSTVDQTEYRYTNDGWRANDSLEAIAQLDARIVFTPEAGGTPKAGPDGKISEIWLPGLLVDEEDLQDLEQLKDESIKPLANYNALRNYSGSASAVRITQYQIAGRFNVLSGSSLQEVEGLVIVDALGRVWMREYYGDVFDTWLGVKVNDHTPSVALLNAQAINRGLDFLGQVFPGRLILSSGTIFLDNTNPSAINWDNRRAIYSRFSSVKMKGAGRGKTVLKLIPGANCHVIKIGSRVEEQVMVSACEITDLEIDGNRLNQLIPSETENHSNGIDVSTGCWGTRLERLYIHDTMYYGIGFQRDQFRDCAVIDVDIERTGGDALDWKDDSDSGTGNIIRGFRAKAFGLSSQVLTEQAGLDLRSGVSAEEIDISDMTGVSGLIAIRMQNGTPGATPVQASSVDRFRVQGSNANNSNGLRVISRYAQASRGYVKGCSNGYNLTNPDARFSALIAELNNVGFRLWQDTAAGVEADTACLVGPIARNNTQAGIVYDSVDEATVLGGDIRNNGIGHDIRSGSTNVRIIGGSCSGNTTQLLDNGEGTIVSSVSGLRTRQVVSASVPIGSTGTKGVSIPHGLGVTPNKKDVQLSLERDTNVGDWDPGFLWVAAVGPTFIDIQLRVITASATSTATVIVNASINAKSAM
ncbi:hypothetical protein V0R52_01190 [Pseudomonas asiatica]|uniref:hypothetical protein n=1 Tax=Pseudomonas asiatica TaxID=2219225 RepID=UPI002E7AD306|nr:hypothetical protein [Pseudomonas asiatica]MEE1914998.1 hypothetical protein [Pseudomonas asiatica]